MISSCPNGHSDCTMQETPAKRGREGGCAAEHTPHPPKGGEGWSLGPGGTRSPRWGCHKVPVLVCTPGLSLCLSLPPFSPGMRWLDTSGMAGKVGMGLGMLHEPAWLPQISLQPPRGATRSWSSVPCWEPRRRRRRMPRPGWHQGPVQRWHWLAEGP